MVRVELDDPSCALGGEVPCLLDAVDRVVVDLRAPGQTRPHPSAAVREPGGAWWVATFTSTVVPTRLRPDAPIHLALSARVLGPRGGLILAIGEDEPLLVEVLSAPEARAQDRALGVRAQGGAARDELELIGYVGADARAGTSARARGLIGAGARLGPRMELGVLVSVGPAFARPTFTTGGGPLVLGFELALRALTTDPALSLFSGFAEPFVGIDLRFPGVDPGAGLRAGLIWTFSADVALEASLGGAIVLFGAAGEEGEEPRPGASGGLRVAARFGGGA